jgi:hypothetical protein
MPVEVNGVFDDRTEAAVMLFQMGAGQSCTGMCGQHTMQGMDNLFGMPNAFGPGGFQRPTGLPMNPPVNPARVMQGATQLHLAMQGLGTDEDAIYGVLEGLPPHEVVAVAQQFGQMFGGQWGSLQHALCSEMSGMELGRAMGALNRAFATAMAGPGAPACQVPNQRFAHAQSCAMQLHRAMAGLGTDENAIYNVLERSSPQDLQMISHEFGRMFGRQWGSLRNALFSEMSGFELQRAVMAHDQKMMMAAGLR